MSARNVMVMDQDYLREWMKEVERQLHSLRSADQRATMRGFTLPISFRTRNEEGYTWLMREDDDGNLVIENTRSGVITIIAAQ